MDVYIKRQLATAYENRKCVRTPHEDKTYDLEITTPDAVLDELYTHINHNVWLEFFLNCTSYRGVNWIDFETEVSRVIQTLDVMRVMASNGYSVMDIQSNKGEILNFILKASKGSLQ